MAEQNNLVDDCTAERDATLEEVAELNAKLRSPSGLDVAAGRLPTRDLSRLKLYL